MNHKYTISIMLILLLFLVGGCKDQHKYRIGVSQCSQDDWRIKLNEEIMREALFYDNIEIEIRSAEDDNLKQMEDLRYFVNNNFDIIIAAPTEADAMTPLIDSIYNLGKPIIIFDRRTNSDNYTMFQGADNKEVGSAAAKYVLMLSESPKIIELEGKLETTPALDRHIGFNEIINSKDSTAILASVVGDWTYEGGKRCTDSLLRLFPETNIIYAHNDRMAIGASDAVKNLGKRKDIKIIGIDASPEIGFKAVLDTVIDATFIYPTGGRSLMQAAVSILNGEEIEKNIILPTRTAVNLSNAEIMLLQNEALKEETNNIKFLKEKLDVYWERYSLQTIVLYGVIAIVVLLCVTVFLLMRSFWIQRRHRALAEEQNKKLMKQHEEIESQNEQLKQKNEEINQILARLQQATQSKLNFFTNVSHDLRTPLTLIAEPVSQILQADNLTEKQNKLIRLASKNIKILMRLINQILDFRKYENGKLNLNLTEVNFGAEIRDWTEAFREVATKRHLKFQVSIPDDQDFSIAIDVEKIERVLFNLLSNAFKFTAPPGMVSVELIKEDNTINLKVKDNGKGINENDIEKIFERYFKNDTISPKGSGIGLALSKAFIELHGGSIEVESAEGKGSTFTVKLPIRHIETEVSTISQIEDQSDNIKSELSPINNDIVEPSEGASTLLVIDDNPDICTLISALMSEEYVVIQASSGLQGIRLATKFVPDIIICDVMMPGIDGLETCKRLKSEVTTSHIPVLLLTACAMDEQRIAGYNSGADAYITKPFNSSLLKSQVESLIKNRKILRDVYLSGDICKDNSDSVRQIGCYPNELQIDNDFYRQFLSIVEANLSKAALNVDDIASQIGISRIQLYRKLKSLTNYSPTDLIRNIRLERASRMLKSTQSTVSEICFAVGFTSHSYFTKCFKEYFGESPSDVQRRTSKVKD